jgi:hypothetical protein
MPDEILHGTHADVTLRGGLPIYDRLGELA